MEFISQKLFFIFFIGIAFRHCVNGNNAGCFCSDNLDDYVDTISAYNTTTCTTDGSKDQNQILGVQNQMLARLDSILKIIQKETTLLTAILQENVLSVANQTENEKKKNISSTTETAVSYRSGIYSIYVFTYGSKPFEVYCDMDLHGGGWIVILRRIDGSVDFARESMDYKEGFGNLSGEFFIGFEKLYALTNDKYSQELLIVMEDFENVTKYAKYSLYKIDNELQSYRLQNLGLYSGNAGDSILPYIEFGCHILVNSFMNAKCDNSCNFFGPYVHSSHIETPQKGIVWPAWHGTQYSLKSAQLMIRPI